MDNLAFVDRIKELLKQKNIQKNDFYNALELPNNSTTNWGKKHQIPNVETVLKIAKYLNVSVEYLIEGNDTEIPQKIISTARDIYNLPTEYQKIVLSIVSILMNETNN